METMIGALTIWLEYLKLSTALNIIGGV